MKADLRLLVLLLALGGCGGKSAGPGLPNCTRSSTTCVATWNGAVSGTYSCTQLSWTNSSGWGFSLEGTNPNSLLVGGGLPSTPSAGQSFNMQQLGGEIQLAAGSDWWAATPAFGGEMLLHVDSVETGSAGWATMHGSLAGSLLRGSAGSDRGVQICITF